MNNIDFAEFFRTLEKGGHPFAMYRFPGEDTVNVIIDSAPGLNILSDPDREKGFVFAPFASDTLPSVLISPSVVTAFPVSGLPEAEIPGNAPFDCGDDTGAREEYEQLVRTAVNEINEGGVKKIVASRTLRMDYRKADFAGMFAAIVRRYPEAMAYYFSHPQIGRWMGATPELLLLRRGGSLHTMSLAGTMPFSGGQKYSWDKKNVEEQAVVSLAIGEAFENNAVEHVKVTEPGNHCAGPVVHLCSHISGRETLATDFGKLLSDLAPTPALSGYPKKAAMAFLSRYEKHSRAFYGGYLGEVNMSGDRTAELYVNIRCMQIHDDHLTLYAGGGITGMSDPSSEWDETCRKIRAVGAIASHFISR